MNRVWDYISFAICFAGIGYVALWLLDPAGHVMLAPALNAIGAVAAAFAPFYLLSCIVRRRGAAYGMPAAPARKPAAVLRPPRPKASYPIRKVKPRSHFGLRGVPE